MTPKYKLTYNLLLVSGNLFLFAIGLNNQQYKVLCGAFFCLAFTGMFFKYLIFILKMRLLTQFTCSLASSKVTGKTLYVTS